MKALRHLTRHAYGWAVDLLIYIATACFVVALGYVDFYAWEIYRWPSPPKSCVACAPSST